MFLCLCSAGKLRGTGPLRGQGLVQRWDSLCQTRWDSMRGPLLTLPGRPAPLLDSVLQWCEPEVAGGGWGTVTTMGWSERLRRDKAKRWVPVAAF